MTRSNRAATLALAGLALLSRAPLAVAGQQLPGVTVSGTVRDADSGAPLLNAVVEIPALSMATLSGEDGTFVLRSVPPGARIIRVRQFGYAEALEVVDLVDSVQGLDFTLEPSPVELEGLDVGVQGSSAITGRVLDGASGDPLPGVYVWLPQEDEGFLSDSSGTFVLPPVATGPQLIQVEAAGYGRRYVPVVVTVPLAPIDIVLVPDSAVLAGLPAVESRLRGRRNAYLGNVIALRTDRLTRRPAANARLFVQNYTLAQIIPCVGAARSHWCVDVRGDPVEATVCIDGELAPGGLDDLQRYRPHELHLLEVYGTNGTTVRAYTHGFVEALARAGQSVLGAEPDGRRGGIEGLGWATRGSPSASSETQTGRWVARC